MKERERKGMTAGILRDKTMEDKLMYIPNDDKYIYPLLLVNKFLGKINLNQTIRIKILAVFEV